MKRVSIVTIVLVVLLCTTGYQSFFSRGIETQDLEFVIQMSVTYSNPPSGTKTWNLTEEDRTVSLFLSNTWQEVQVINHSHPFETEKVDEDENPIAVLKFPEPRLKPSENISYTVSYHALSKPRTLPDITEEESGTLSEVPNDLDKYSGAEGPWLVDDSELRDLASDITKNEIKVLTIVKMLITWIRDNISYETHETPLYANETFGELKGDCDDQGVLFITLCRILGIPSYLQVGCIYLPEVRLEREKYWDDHLTAVQKHIGWHGWAMVYVPPWGWLPVDFTYVKGGLADPLNAIRQSAVVAFQTVIQYMNIIESDYVARAREVRNFLQQNDFYVYEEDSMIFDSDQREIWRQTLEGWIQWVLAITVISAISVPAVFMLIWRNEKRARKKLVNSGDNSSVQDN